MGPWSENMRSRFFIEKLILLIEFIFLVIEALEVHETQYLGCVREGLDHNTRNLLHDVRFDLKKCASYCILQDSLTFGIMSDGYCTCSDTSFDLYDVYADTLCGNPCLMETSDSRYTCGGNVVYVSYYRTCPPYSFGLECENMCMCASSLCRSLSGVCHGSGCLRDVQDSSPRSDMSICLTLDCEKLTGNCKDLCLAGRNIYDLYNCSCLAGYEMNIYKFICQDIDECHLPKAMDCDFCLNTEGNYECTCKSSSIPVTYGGRTYCDPPPLLTELCSTCEEDKACTFVNDTVRCVCPDGMSNETCFHRIRCQDLVYCHICDIDFHGIACRCRTGYILVDYYVCLDVNECLTSSCKSCINFPGSMICQCPDDCLCTDPLVRPFCRTTYVMVPVHFNYLGAGNFPNKAVQFFKHQHIALGVFADASLKYILSVKSYWYIEGLLNKTIQGTFLRLSRKHVKPGKYCAYVQFRHFTKRKTLKLYFNIMFYSEHKLEPSGVFVATQPSQISLSVVPYLRRIDWKCSHRTMPTYEAATTSSPDCRLNSSFEAENEKLKTNNMYTRVVDITIHFTKRIRATQMAFDMTTFLFSTSRHNICISNCDDHPFIDESIQLKIDLAGNYFYHWSFKGGATLALFGVGVNAYDVPFKTIWDLPPEEQTIYLKTTNLDDIGDAPNVFSYSFLPKQRQISDCTPEAHDFALLYHDKILKGFTLSCGAGGEHNIIFKTCDSEEQIWIYSGGVESILNLAVLVDDNADRKYCITDIRIADRKEYVEPISKLNFQKSEVKVMDISLEIARAKASTIMVETIPKIYFLAKAIVSKKRIGNIEGLLLENREERHQLLSILSTILKNHRLERIQIFLLIKSLELLTRHIEALNLTNIENYDLTDYINMFDDIANAEATRVTAERFCSSADFYRVVVNSISHLSWIYVRESEEPQTNVNPTKLMEMLKSNARLSLEKLSTQKNDLELEMDFFKLYLYHFNVPVVGSFVTIPATDNRLISVNFDAPQNNFSAEISALGLQDMKDNSVILTFVPYTVNLKHRGARVNPTEGFEIGYRLASNDRPSRLKFLADAARMIISSNLLISNGSNIFSVDLSLKFNSTDRRFHRIMISLHLCPRTLNEYDDNVLKIICRQKLNKIFYFVEKGTWHQNFTVLRKDYVASIFKVIICLDNFAFPMYVGAALLVNKLACISYNESVGNWSFYGCESLYDYDQLLCQCPLSDEYSAYSLSLPLNISIDEFKPNLVGVVKVVLLWLVIVVIAILAALYDSHAELLSIPVDLGDNLLRAPYCYLVIVNTGNVMNAGATTGIFISLIGSNGKRVVSCLKCNLFPVLRRCHKNLFIVRTKTNLGHILVVRMWHRGLDTLSNWFVQDIKVVDLQTQSSYFFLCYSWVGINSIDWHSSLLSVILTHDNFHKPKYLLPRNIYRYVQFKHKILSIFLMPGRYRFCRFDRVISFAFRIIFLAYASLNSKADGFDLNAMYVNIAGIRTSIIISDVPGSASDAVTGKPKYRWTYHLRKKFFMRCLTPGAIVILVVMAVLSVVTVLSSYRKRADFLLHWEKIGMASYFFTFVVVETFEFFLVIGLYTFVVKSEVHPEVINVDKILYTIRGELSESTGLILADAILTKRQNFKYKRPIFNQFTDFTQEYLLHKIVYISRYIDILFSILLLIIFVLFCLNGFVGPSQEQSEINTVLSQVFEEQGVRQIHTKEEFWNYVDRIFTKAFSQGSKNDGHVGFNEANEEFLRNATDEMLDEFVEKINFEKFFTSMFLLSNNATLVSETSCMINLVSNKYNMIIAFGELQPASWKLFCFTGDRNRNLNQLRGSISMSTLHKNVNGLALKFYLYTPDVNVFSMITIATVNTPSGRIRSRIRILTRKFYRFEDLNRVFVFFCLFLFMIYFLIITHLLHVYYDGFYIFLTIFRYLIQLLSLSFSLLFLASILLNVYDNHLFYTDRLIFLRVSYNSFSESLLCLMYILAVSFTLLRPILFCAHKFELGRYYWNSSYSKLHQAYAVIFMALAGHAISLSWNLRRHFETTSFKRAIIISSMTIVRASGTKRIGLKDWGYINLAIFLMLIAFVKGIIFSKFFYNKDWKESGTKFAAAR